MARTLHEAKQADAKVRYITAKLLHLVSYQDYILATTDVGGKSTV